MESDLSCEDGHERQGMRWYAMRVERNITKILENKGIDTAAGQGVGVPQDPVDDGVEPELVLRGAGQRRHVQHTDDRFALGFERIPQADCHEISRARLRTRSTALSDGR